MGLPDPIPIHKPKGGKGRAWRLAPHNLKTTKIDFVKIKLVRESTIKYEGGGIKHSSDAVNFVKNYLEDCDREMVMALFLDSQNKPTGIQTISIGTINFSLIHPREVFKAAILSNATALILFHNHPSGLTKPSTEDINITNKLQEAGKIIGINVLDHTRYASDAKGGYYPTPPDELEYVCRCLKVEGKGLINIYAPCCGEGTALKQLSEHLKMFHETTLRTHGIELEKGRTQYYRNVAEKTRFQYGMKRPIFCIFSIHFKSPQ